MPEPIELVAGIAIGQGVGQAVGDVVKPRLQGFANEQWAAHQNRPIDAMTLAAGVSQGQIGYDTARVIASHTGISQTNFDHLIEIANVGPGVAIAFDLFRRGIIEEPGFRRAVKRLALEQEWIDDLVQLKTIRLSPATVANAVQQGHMPNDGVLPTIDASVSFPAGYQQAPAPDDAPPSSVPLTEIPINPRTEAAAHGVDFERLQIEANLSGLPPGPEALLAMWNRNLIDEESVDAGIREGHMKTKWAHAFKRMRWAVLSGQEYAEAWLREWVTEKEAYRGGALTGHTPAQMRLLFENRGRPASPTQIWTAWARKVIGPRDVPTDFTDHEQAIRRSNIRPEYARMLWEIRYVYPPVFQINRLVTGGVIDAATGADWLHKNRYAPEVVDAFTAYWTQGAGTTADPHVGRAQTQLWTTAHSSYVNSESDDAAARARLAELGLAAADQDAVMRLWESERELVRRQLTPKQVKDAWQGGVANLATGAPWTHDDARSRLVGMGYSLADAETFLSE